MGLHQDRIERIFNRLAHKPSGDEITEEEWSVSLDHVGLISVFLSRHVTGEASWRNPLGFGLLVIIGVIIFLIPIIACVVALVRLHQMQGTQLWILIFGIFLVIVMLFYLYREIKGVIAK